MAVNLLLCIGLVKIFVRCGVEVIDQLLMFGSRDEVSGFAPLEVAKLGNSTRR
jgi:hypothetical protein